MSNTLTGTLKLIRDTKVISEKFSTKEFVLTDNSGKFAQFITFQASNKAIEWLDKFKEGDGVMVTFSIRGREWSSPSGEVKYFNTLDAFKIESAVIEGQTQTTTTSTPTQAEPDLPF